MPYTVHGFQLIQLTWLIWGQGCAIVHPMCAPWNHKIGKWGRQLHDLDPKWADPSELSKSIELIEATYFMSQLRRIGSKVSWFASWVSLPEAASRLLPSRRAIAISSWCLDEEGGVPSVDVFSPGWLARNVYICYLSILHYDGFCLLARFLEICQPPSPMFPHYSKTEELENCLSHLSIHSK